MYGFIFWILFLLIIFGLGIFLFSHREDSAVVSLVLVFASLGGIFALMGYPFLGSIFVLIYAGAIVVAFLMVVWLIAGRSQGGRSLWIVSIFVFLALCLELLALLLSTKNVMNRAGASVVELGKFFLGRYLYIFELTSLLILTAVISALVLLRRRT